MKQHRIQAFTLVEIIVSSLIIVSLVGFVLAYSVFVQETLYKERFRVVVLEFANAALEDFVFNLDFNDAGLSLGNHAIPAADLPTVDIVWQRAAPSFTYTVAAYQIDPADPLSVSQAKQITLTANWQEPSRNGTTAGPWFYPHSKYNETQGFFAYLSGRYLNAFSAYRLCHAHHSPQPLPPGTGVYAFP